MLGNYCLLTSIGIDKQCPFALEFSSWLQRSSKAHSYQYPTCKRIRDLHDIINIMAFYNDQRFSKVNKSWHYIPREKEWMHIVYFLKKKVFLNLLGNREECIDRITSKGYLHKVRINWLIRPMVDNTYVCRGWISSLSFASYTPILQVPSDFYSDSMGAL